MKLPPNKINTYKFLKTIMKYIFLTIALLFALNIHAQDDKTVTLVVSGSGKTQEEAKQNALRSAIEQAFGTFISSETIIKNDSFISDNITSLSQGSILNFTILSSSNLPNSHFETTLNATVSISQLKQLTESKGHKATIQGGLFGINIRMQKLQSEAEIKIIDNLKKQSLEILKNSVDFKLEIASPQMSNIQQEYDNLFREGGWRTYYPILGDLSIKNIYKIQLLVECRANGNLDVFIDYFNKTLNSIQLNKTDIEFAHSAGIKIYPLNLKTSSELIYLRSDSSLKIIEELLDNANQFVFNYSITSNDNLVNFKPSDFKITFPKSGPPRCQSLKIYDSCHYISFGCIEDIRHSVDNYDYYVDSRFPAIMDHDVQGVNVIKLYKTSQGFGEIWHYNRGSKKYKKFPAKNNINVRYHTYDVYMQLNEIEKLVEIKVNQT
jgi:hypothetical protein